MVVKLFWGHISDSSLLEPVAPGIRESTRNPKVPKACVAIWSNQNIALYVRSINMWVGIQTILYHLQERYNRVIHRAREDTRGHRRPPRAVTDMVSGVPLPISMGAYQH